MALNNFLKPTKDMTDDDLLAEFQLAQKVARRQGRHLPLTVTKTTPEGSGEKPTIHRPTTERDLDIFRKGIENAPEALQHFRTELPRSSLKNTRQEQNQHLAQKQPSDIAKAAKSIGKGNSIHGAGQSFLEGVGAMLGISKKVKERQLNRFRQSGKLGESFEDAVARYGETEGAKEAYQEGVETTRRNRNKKR